MNQPVTESTMSKMQSLLREYPILKELGISLLAGGGLALAGGMAKKQGYGVNPALMGLVGAASPFIFGALSNTGVAKNIGRYGFSKGLLLPTSQLKYQENSPGYIKKYLRSVQGAGTLPSGYKKPDSLDYSDLAPINYFQNKARHPLIKKMDNAKADEKALAHSGGGYV